jgi:Transposase.
MTTVFWDSQGVIYIDYLEKGKMVTGLYYAEILGQFDTELQKKYSHLEKKKVLFQHDNTPAHASTVATAKLVELHYELLPHLPYSSHLAPSKFVLFPNSKKSLAKQKFESNEEVITDTEAYFANLE